MRRAGVRVVTDSLRPTGWTSKWMSVVFAFRLFLMGCVCVLAAACANTKPAQESIAKERQKIAAVQEQLSALLQEIRNAASESDKARTTSAAAIDISNRAQEIAGAAQAELGCRRTHQ